MKKLVILLSFVFVLGLISVSAQDTKKEVKKAPVKTEKVGVKPAKNAKPAEKAKPAVKHIHKDGKMKKEATKTEKK
ncbi:MAG: hypothetical protein WCJ95_01585 [Mariniphaga sp.]